MNTDGLNEIIESIRVHLDAKHRAREQALPLCRETIRLSANAIRAVHRRDFDAAEKLIAQGRGNLEQVAADLADHRDIFHAGFVHDAQKEYAEARGTLAIIAGRPLPTPEELAVELPAYLNGLGEVVGELRRHLLDALRGGDVDHCERTLASMDDIYSVLVTIDYPDAMTAGLRRTTDAVRGILERTRGDLTVAVRQRELEQRLAEFQERLS
ncbi:MAG: haloacid dehalogenase [Chloroflexi bacterium]|nr:haloacid dehalogenase [Chloroflexota bacterium]